MLSRRLLMGGRGGGAFTVPEWTRGTLTPDGTPVIIQADEEANGFPGITWLDDDRCLLVWRRGSTHFADGEIYGRIGTVTGTSVSWGSAFLIYTNAEDVRCEDAVNVIDGRPTIAARLYNGSTNHDPFLLICDDTASAFTSSSSWSTVAVPLTLGSTQNLMIGRVQQLQNGIYAIGYNCYDGSSSENGVVLSDALDDWSSLTTVNIGANGTNPKYTEIDVEEMPDGELVAHLRTEVATTTHYVSTSDDHGATWSAPSTLFSAWGYPAWRRLTSGMRLTVYRQSSVSPPYRTYWRQSDDDGATWSSETLLDGTDIDGVASDNAYASFLQLDDLHVLCVYSIEKGDASGSEANLYSQVFTDSSTYG